jgi:hypothetical protein
MSPDCFADPKIPVCIKCAPRPFLEGRVNSAEKWLEDRGRPEESLTPDGFL